jgi:hypothetical protein
MSNVLYYSKYCKSCQTLLYEISKSKVKEELHFICIDKRVKKNNAIYIQLENGTEILLPPNIRKVPALLMLSRGHQVIEGNNIKSYILEKTQEYNNQATDFNGEPLEYSLNDFGSIKSDNYSYLDQSADEMSAKGTGGMRQIHNYATINQQDMIETPPDTYTPDKVGKNGMSVEQYQAQRDKDVPRQPPRM